MTVRSSPNHSPRRHALTVAVGLALASGGVHAASFDVTNTDDDGAGSLRQAIIDANGSTGPHSIIVDAALGGQTIALESDLPSIEEDLTLQGSEVTLSGQTEHACLSVDEADLEVEQITIDSCSGFVGAAIYVDYGNLIVRDATITNNTAVAFGGGIFVAGNVRGEPEYTALIENSVISQNSAGDEGGGVSLKYLASATIAETTITENSADRGGGAAVMYIYQASITDSTISQNTADEGGGLNLYTLETQLENSTVSGNSAVDDGGGIFFRGGLHLHSGTSIDNNTAGYFGGGLSSPGFSGNQPQSSPPRMASQRGSYGFPLAIVDATISGNSADIGGGFFILPIPPSTSSEQATPRGSQAEADVLIERSAISGNSAYSMGGGLHFGYASDVRVIDSVISENTAVDVVGGMAVAQYAGQFLMSGTTVSSNEAGYFAGGLVVDSKYSEAQIVNSTISGNTAGEIAGVSIYGDGDSQVELIGITIAGNEATEYFGGGLTAEFEDPNTLFILNSVIAGNDAVEGSGDLSAGTAIGNQPEPQNTRSHDRWIDRLVSRSERFADAIDGHQYELGSRNNRIPDNTTFDVSFSLIGEAPDTGNFAPDAATTDALGADPELAVLDDNGGPTPTHMPSPTSPALSLVENGENGCGGDFDIDQRGQMRPSTVGSNCDAGSVERQAPAIDVGPDRDFGSVLVGGTGGPLDITMSNTGESVLEVTGFDNLAAPFNVDFADCGTELPFEILPGESCLLSAAFSPAATGDFDQTIAVASNSASGEDQFTLSGIGVMPIISVGPDGNFGPVNVGDTAGPQTVTVNNTGSADLEVSGFAGLSAPFDIDFADCGASLPFSLAAGSNCDLAVAFSPTMTGAFDQLITVQSDAGDGDDQFMLSGQGVEGDLELNPGSGDFGELDSGTSGEIELTLTNGGDGDVEVENIVGPNEPFSIVGGDCPEVPFVLGPGESCALIIEFSPGAEGDYEDSVAVHVSDEDEPLVFSVTGSGTPVVEPPAVRPVPTLDRIGMIIGAGLLALMGLFGIRRRRRI